MKSLKSVSGMPEGDMERLREELFEVFRQVGAMSFVMKTGMRGDPIYSNMLCAMHVDNSRRLLDAHEKCSQDANKLLQNAKPGTVKSLTVKRLEIGGKAALQQELNFDLASMGVPEASRPLMDEMLGIGGKMVAYLVAADEHTVLMGIGVSQERMAAALNALKQPKKGLAEDPDLSVTAAMLPADAQWVAYLSFYGYMQLGQRFMNAMMKNEQEAMGFSMPPFPSLRRWALQSRPRPPSCTARSPFPRRWSRPTAIISKKCSRCSWIARRTRTRRRRREPSCFPGYPTNLPPWTAPVCVATCTLARAARRRKSCSMERNSSTSDRTITWPWRPIRGWRRQPSLRSGPKVWAAGPVL